MLMKAALQVLGSINGFITANPFLRPYVYTVCKRSRGEHGTREGNATAYTNQTVWERELKRDSIMKIGHMLMLSGFQHTPHTSTVS